MTSTNPSNSTSGPVFILDNQLDTIAGTVNADQPAIAPAAPGILTATISPPDSAAPSTSNAPVLATQEPSVNQGLICTRCGFQMPMLPKEPYYIITIGTAVGIFSDSVFTQSLVTGVSSGSFKKYTSLGVAQHVYNAAITAKIVHMVG
ncbi:hypothetical protein GYMLUDRAFT_64409 [Collybiopsis luxurians FD-317 M1]|uniref:Uncharacterized protein n=1 Tax=Collybiopsis luxurians FD-317 M1 TaxID=944289 RepID=A0A0D0BR37_9AGAR|nr:hypothetical protein GYMLUDRAFT_64409 [Collybiopsis luxurians FD-317 M1]